MKRLVALSSPLTDLSLAELIVAVVIVVAGCGGGEDLAAPVALDAEPLFDDRGTLITAAAVRRTPASPAEQSVLGHYVTRDQYEHERLINRDRTVLLSADEGIAVEVDLALTVIQFHDDPAAVNFFVRGADAQAAARLADALAAAGLRRVFVIV